MVMFGKKVENIFLMCVDCGCNTRISHGDENLRNFTVYLGSGRAGLDAWKATLLPDMTMEEIVALRHGLDGTFAPWMALALDNIIADAEGS